MDKETQILEAAMKLLIEHGTQGTPMSAIARAANTGMGTIYNYFATKEELINAIYLYVKRNQLHSVAEPATDEPIKRRFDRYYTSLLQYLVAHPEQFRFMDHYQNAPVLTPTTRQQGLETIAPVADLLAKGQQQGIVKEIGIDELLEFLNGGMMGVVRWVLNNDKPLTQTFLDSQARIAWDAIKQ
ncbi:TetR/AcrR family transcriptional regulator [Hymenobacter sp. GOD-10R]|uniref:TetR/AcrR family transcriptional regulator n=1 Tax=Hymenobacter sp. GOD-10R TaxID=3093922 RepID=UPI002D79BB19|nr:TetR/AcrR family transcriptional regulator [Hymenobacter sp. GOD-10R]WRQ26372.1 TetR/AcrR family transcriptional regulator [Hymenobacter sp. GOD-10R]